MKDDATRPDNPGTMLHETIMDLMPQFVIHIDPIVHRARFRGMKLNENQIKVLMLLHHAGPVSPGFISHHLNIQKGSLTAVLRNLRHKGLISRVTVEGDERSYRVHATEAGRDFVRFHLNECQQKLGHVFGSMDHTERLQVEKGLDLLTRYLRSRGGKHA